MAKVYYAVHQALENFDIYYRYINTLSLELYADFPIKFINIL